jgi:hypothetical protein
MHWPRAVSQNVCVLRSNVCYSLRPLTLKYVGIGYILRHIIIYIGRNFAIRWLTGCARYLFSDGSITVICQAGKNLLSDDLKICSIKSWWFFKRLFRKVGDRIPEGARFSAHVQSGSGAHPASCTIGTGSFPGVKSCRGVTLTPHLLLVLWSRKSRAIPLLPLRAVRPVQSLIACTRVYLTFYLIFSARLY